MSPVEFTAPAPAGARPVEYASFGRRLGAALLDSAVWIVGLSFVNPFAVVGDEVAAAIVSVVILSAWFNYFAICEWRWGQTIGKNATGIEVRSLDGSERLTYGQASIRNLLRLIDFFVIGEVMIAATKSRQRLGDKAARTVVLRRAPRTATTKRVAPPRNGSRSRAPSRQPSHNA
jgi:uncharacterized RDD family membrane protein YckC